MRPIPAPAALVLLLVLAACGSDTGGPGGPADATCPGATVPLCSDAAYAARVQAAAGDALARLAPTLPDGLRDALLPDLQALAAALDAGAVGDASRAAQDLRAALASGRATAASGELPSLDAIALAVIQAEHALGLTPPPLPRVIP